MNNPEILEAQAVRDILTAEAQRHTPCVMSHVASGQWRITNVAILDSANETLCVVVQPIGNPTPLEIQVHQPIGISIEQGHMKYIFETIVRGVESSVTREGLGRIILELPEKMEKVQRRTYERVPVPESMKVKVLFWHRGYTDNTKEVPLDNYWEGRLIDISAGGLQIGINLDQKPNFRTGQLVGLQFATMSHQKPICAEAQVKHIAETADGAKLCLGVEFVGLEATSEGRHKLHKIIDSIKQYREKNKQNLHKAAKEHGPAQN